MGNRPLEQWSPNFLVRGPHMLRHNNSIAGLT